MYSTTTNFYPRSPCGERLVPPMSLLCPSPFLSTLSLRRATCPSDVPVMSLTISIHALLAESDEFLATLGKLRRKISIHALLAESDAFLPADRMSHQEFLSTLSLRRATRVIDIINNVIDDFYPRSPCGERLVPRVKGGERYIISIHALLAESDPSFCGLASNAGISIHALLAESDHPQTSNHPHNTKFLSTLSLRRATK